MNFLGKIFVVALLVMSVVFMSLAIVVYATHKDWKSQADAANQQLREARADFDALQTQYNRLESQLTAEREAALQQVRKLETERVRLVGRNGQTQAQLDELRERERESIAAVAATQQNNSRLADEVESLRTDVLDNQAARDRMFVTALRATEEMQARRNELESAVERNRQLTATASRMTSLLRENNLDPNTPADAIKPSVDGFVSRTERRGGQQLVEISIGSDDGLKKGHTVEVFNKTKYLGRLEIIRTAPDRAVGRVDVRFQQGPIQEGDRVATRLQLG